MIISSAILIPLAEEVLERAIPLILEEIKKDSELSKSINELKIEAAIRRATRKAKMEYEKELKEGEEKNV